MATNFKAGLITGATEGPWLSYTVVNFSFSLNIGFSQAIRALLGKGKNWKSQNPNLVNCQLTLELSLIFLIGHLSHS